MKRFFSWAFVAMITLCALMLTGGSTDNNQTSEQEYAGVPLVILDTDIGSSADDLFSLEMLYYYQQQGQCTLLGVVVDREGED